MEKYYFNNEEVCIGDTLVITSKSLYDGVLRSFTRHIPLTKELLETFIREDIITKKTIKNDQKLENFSSEYILGRLSKRVGWSTKTIIHILSAMNTINPVLVFTVLLKEIAIIFDKKYPDHISDSSEIYTISLISGRIIKVKKDLIKNYTNFAAFRSVEEASKAVVILKKLYKSLFVNAEK